jgi:hypothetical protein
MKAFSRRAFALVPLFFSLATSIALSQTSDPIAAAAKLSQPDVYYWTGSDWQPMEPVTWTSSGVKKTGKASVWSYRHPVARIQMAGTQPLFCYKTSEDARTSNPPNLVIARLDQKKDHRELQTPTTTGAFALGAGLGNDRTVGTRVRAVSDSVFVFSPEQPLQPGEYVVGGGSLAITGYDFGLRGGR